MMYLYLYTNALLIQYIYMIGEKLDFSFIYLEDRRSELGCDNLLLLKISEIKNTEPALLSVI